MDGRVKEKLKKPRTCINGMFPKGPTNSWSTLVQTWSTKRYYSASVPVKGKLLLVLGGYGMVTTDLATSDSCMLQMAASPASPALVIITPPWHRRHLTPMALEALTILTEAVFGCATFNSPMHDNREVVLAVGGYEQSHCSSPRLFPTQIPAWTTSNYYSFIWLFYLTVLHYSWNSTTFCLKTMLSFILHPRDWCVILQSHKHRHIDRYVIQRFHGFANISRIKQECLNPPCISHLGL